MPKAPELKFDRSYIPLRFVSKALGYNVEWKPEIGDMGQELGEKGTVIIISK